ncbi:MULTISPECIES: helix-turn-helix domain-containing protein [Photobacterium]|uniref:helix-turn-helix domain-containing protein n=1 Tax=Photobacterium TaxID=657 RepID=UPI001EFE7924|nr:MULTISPECIES: helix-turn-helix transcriptional regulator [Photobacterium]MCG9777612.1 helix-turn-helix domain-containing protein [Photobacterium damselae]
METPIPIRLKWARKAAGYTQQQLGMELGMDPNTASARMNQYERGKHTPDYQTMQRIGKVLKVPTAYFYCDDDRIAMKLIELFKEL